MNRDIIDTLLKFRDDRDWKKFHTPQNLAKSICIEAAELLEEFQWSEEPKDLQNLKEEIADVLIYTILLAEHYKMDIDQIINSKIEKNAIKYLIND